MAAVTKKPEVNKEQEKVEEWRRYVFNNLFPKMSPDDVEVLVHSDADLHYAEKLANKDCPADIAFKILW